MATDIVLHLSNRFIKVFKVFKHKIHEETRFDIVDQNTQAFRVFLHELGQHPVRIVINTKGELLNFQKMPRIFGQDRKNLLERKIQQIAPDNEFTYVHKLGYEKTKKRDEQILICALSNSEHLKPWLDCLFQNHNPVLGIFSTPIIRETVCQLLSPDEHSLIVSTSKNREKGKLQSRQCYFINGKLVLNRVESNNLRADVYSDIFREMARTRNYLLRAHKIDHNKKLPTYLIIDSLDVEQATQSSSQLSQIQLNILTFDELAQIIGMRSSPDRADFDNITAFLCARKHRWKNHYQSDTSRYFLHHHQLNIGMKVASIAVFLSVLLYGTLSWLDIQQVKNGIANTQTAISQINRQIDAIPPSTKIKGYTPIQIRSLMQANETINKRIARPAHILNPVSMVLVNHPLIKLRKIEWQKTPLQSDDMNQSQSNPDSAIMNPTTQTITDPGFTDPGSDSNLQSQNNGKSLIYMRIYGELHPFNGDYREANLRINQFVASLTRHQDIPSATANLLPMDIRSSVDLSGEVKINEDKKNSAMFSIDASIEIKPG